jgi:hypothetical protein
MSGLIKFKFGFENILKICFEKLEKEKKEKKSRLIPDFGPSQPALPRPAYLPAPAFSRMGRAQARPVGPASRARLPSPVSAADFAGPRVSRVPFPKLPARSFPKTPPTESAAKSPSSFFLP